MLLRTLSIYLLSHAIATSAYAISTVAEGVPRIGNTTSSHSFLPLENGFSASDIGRMKSRVGTGSFETSDGMTTVTRKVARDIIGPATTNAEGVVQINGIDVLQAPREPKTVTRVLEVVIANVHTGVTLGGSNDIAEPTTNAEGILQISGIDVHQATEANQPTNTFPPATTNAEGVVQIDGIDVLQPDVHTKFVEVLAIDNGPRPTPRTKITAPYLNPIWGNTRQRWIPFLGATVPVAYENDIEWITIGQTQSYCQFPDFCWWFPEPNKQKGPVYYKTTIREVRKRTPGTGVMELAPNTVTATDKDLYTSTWTASSPPTYITSGAAKTPS
ncbi:hypothetical protein E4T47_02307 [Aureobasidium subglaciale]|nr:hypothetical protein E4T47_02307 [Aureobasidium subglaciale]